jgi:hypothetical protein
MFLCIDHQRPKTGLLVLASTWGIAPRVLTPWHLWLASKPGQFEACTTWGTSCCALQDYDDVRRKLKGSGFQIVFDINGREAEEAEPLVDALGRDSLEQYIYCSRWVQGVGQTGDGTSIAAGVLRG